MRLAIVSATADLERSRSTRLDWYMRASGPVDSYVVINGPAGDTRVAGKWHGGDVLGGKRLFYDHPEYLGVVPAFAIGVAKALQDGAEIIACLHDDTEILETGWDQRVIKLFEQHPNAGLCGFGGALGLADEDIYQSPYRPMQLARKDFRSNMTHAEAHGTRERKTMRVSCLDGFSQIGRREFWQGYATETSRTIVCCPTCKAKGFRPSAQTNRCSFCDGQVNFQIESQGDLFILMQSWGMRHHAYDAALGCFAARLGWETWLLPISCAHHGGLTAVADGKYQEWAKTQTPDGDAGFWNQAHEIVYSQFKDVLPLRVS